jgi:alkylation response protein AidB-like acyl-CoA dehydrogenase
MLNSANLSFALCPLLTDGAIEALLTAGSDELKATYLEKLISGEWTGTMNLTEPQAGSDLALVRTRPSRSPTAPTRSSAPRSSSPTASTTWPRTSSTWCWPVAGAPEGVKGISLFVVPKFLVNADGSWARATTCTASASSTRWASRPAPRPCCSSATTAAPSATWWARRTAASNTCSS